MDTDITDTKIKKKDIETRYEAEDMKIDEHGAIYMECVLTKE